MSYMFVSFRSRTAVFQAYNYLISRGISCALLSTPREVYAGCGLSIRFAPHDYLRVRGILGSGNITFAGYWNVTVVNGRRVIVKV